MSRAQMAKQQIRDDAEALKDLLVTVQMSSELKRRANELLTRIKNNARD